VFTDHEAWKVLLNTPHPSGKQARWGRLLEMIHRAGRHNYEIVRVHVPTYMNYSKLIPR